MGDNEQANAAPAPAEGSKPKTAVEGNAPGGPDFHNNGPVASGSKAVLGAQVRPETQVREDRPYALANPVTDPGPYVPDGQHEITHPDPAKGETYASVNDPLKIVQRGDTSRDAKLNKTTMAPELVAHGGASDVYNPERGEGLTDRARELSGEPREPAPVHRT